MFASNNNAFNMSTGMISCSRSCLEMKSSVHDPVTKFAGTKVVYVQSGSFRGERGVIC